MFASISKVKNLSPVWIVPIISCLVGCWFIYNYYHERGQEVVLITKNSENIEAGKTKIKSRSVNVGDVIGVELAEDLSNVHITIRLDKKYDHLLHENSSFWIVKPRIDSQGVSGLGTLLSGSYIELLPGDKGEAKESYSIEDNPIRSLDDYDGTVYTLTSSDKKSVSEGDVITYRGINVGFVNTANFSIEKRQMEYQAFIYKPYDKLITNNTRFWISTGVSVNVSSSGMSVETASLESFIKGGVTFDEPKDLPNGKAVEPGHRFVLYKNEEASRTPIYTDYLEYVLFFDSSINGLNPGASVEYLGYRIGTVQEVPFPKQIDFNNDKHLISVLIRIERGRFVDDELTNEELQYFIEDAIKTGYKAKLSTSSIVTGAKYIEIVKDPNATNGEIERYKGYIVVPSMPDEMESILTNLKHFTDKLNNIPVDSLMSNMNKLLANSSETAHNLSQISKSLNELLTDENTQELPKDLHLTLQKLQKSLDSYSDNSGFYKDLAITVKELNVLLRNLSATTEKVSEKPNSLIFDVDKKDPLPRKPR